MNGLAASLVPALGWAFLHFLWQGLLVWAATALAMLVLRGARARYAAACAGLLLCAALPVAGVLGRLATPGVDPAPVVRLAAPVASTPSVTPLPLPALPPTARVQAALAAHLNLVVLLWATGASLLALRLASGLTWVRRIGTRDAVPAEAAWQQRMARLAEALGLGRTVALRVSGAIDSPLSMGWWRPVILLPAALVAGMDPCLLEALLAHELAHVKRFDYLANLLQTAVEILLFYHPGVWWISRRIRQERELICDDLAARTLGEPRRLVLALRELDTFQLSKIHLAQGAHGGNLMNRIRSLILPESRPVAWKAVVGLAGFTALCGISAAALAPPPQSASKAAPKASAAAEDKKEVAFALVSKKKDGIIRSGPGAPNKELWALRAKLEGDFLWFRSQGKSYLVEDPATVAKARAIYQPLEDMGQKMGDLGAKMGEVGAKQGEIGARMGEVGAKQGAIGAKQGAIGAKQGLIGGKLGQVAAAMAQVEMRLDSEKLGAAEREGLQSKLKGLKQQMAGLEKQMAEAEVPMAALDKEMREAGKPMEDLNKAMEEAGRPMKDLEAQMKVLEKEMKGLEKEADAGMRQLVEESLKNGMAKPSGN
jgi:beta-lactamase regulating signal transducer with metallopeptidase domain